MTKLEKLLGVLILISLLLKLYILPHGGTLLAVSMMALVLYYLQFGKAIFNDIELKKSFKKDSYKEVPNSLITISKGTGIALSLVCLGIMFKLNHWGSSSMIFVVGLGIITLISVVAMVGWIKSKNETYKRILSRVLIIGGFGLMVAMTPSLTITKIQFRNHPDYIRAYENYLQDQDNKEICEKLDIEFNKVIMSEKEFIDFMKNRLEE
jgi:hypothetical protein